MDWDFNVLLFLILSVVCLVAGLLALALSGLFKRKRSLVIPNRFYLFFGFLAVAVLFYFVACYFIPADFP